MSSKKSARLPDTPNLATGHLSRSAVARLCAALFAVTPLEPFCQTWATENPRFAAFLDSYQDKIAKKLRGVRAEEGFFDLLAELDVAHCLLRERGLTLSYEPYLAEKRRGPDFAVTLKTHMLCNVEVRHLRQSSAEPGARLGAILADKLRQLPPSAPNVLALSGATDGATPQQLERALQAFQREATRDLSRYVERLSAVAVLASASAPALMWEQPRARHPLALDLRKALARAFGGV